MRSVVYTIIAIAFLVLFSFCRKDIGLSNFGNYPNDVGKIIVTQCAVSGCHNDASYLAANALNLTSWDKMFLGSNSGSPVIPFSSKFSSLCYFINTYPELGLIVKPTMPINNTRLSKEEVKLIQNWIDNGAPDVNGKIKWSDNPNRKKVYVANQGCDVVTVFDSETQLPIRFIEVGLDPNIIEVPHMVRVSPDNQYWYVVFVNSNIMQKYRCSDDQLVGTANLGSNFDWNTFTITNDGAKAFCVAWASNGHIAAVDLQQMKLIRNFGGYSYPHGIALNGPNDMLYVTGQSGNFIYQLDTAFNTVNQISLNGLPPSTASSLDPHEILLSADTNYFYITCQKSNQVGIYNIASKTTSFINTATYPLEMALDVQTNRLFVSCMNDTSNGSQGSVEVIDIISKSSIANIKVGSLPHGLAIDQSKKLLYVVSRNILSNGPAPHHSSACSGRNGFVSFIELNTLNVKKRKYEISTDPYSAAYRN